MFAVLIGPIYTSHNSLGLLRFVLIVSSATLSVPAGISQRDLAYWPYSVSGDQQQVNHKLRKTHSPNDQYAPVTYNVDLMSLNCSTRNSTENMPVFTDLSPYIVITVHVMFFCQFLVALYMTEQTAVL